MTMILDRGWTNAACKLILLIMTVACVQIFITLKGS